MSPSSSNETSINLSIDISNLISDVSGEVSFIIYKIDLVKAISVLCLLPEIYLKKDTKPAKPYDILYDLTKQITAQFGVDSTSTYNINMLKRDDGRAYFNDLKKPNGFNFRSFLVEQLSEITFIKTDSGALEMRLHTSLSEEDVERKPIEESSSFVSNLPLQQIYYGAPGTGKSYTIDDLTNEDNSVRTTFHPDSDYASFVGAYKPTMESVPMSAFVGKEVHIAQPQGAHPGKECKIVYKYVPQAFLKAYVEAWKRYTPDEDIPYYLIIEEINRGNCAQIFGDLFQLLDRNNNGCSSYAISADEDISQFLRDDDKGFKMLSEDQRKAIGDFILVKDSGKEEHIGQNVLNGSKLLLPPNLRIWATMNTSDQSLFPIDSAFKRRWNWKYMPIEYHPVDKNGKPIDWKFQIGDILYSWGEFLKKINPEIYTLTESSDKQMGYFFAKADPSTGVISEEVFLNKVLFYLWTDVFKDYDVSSDLFHNEKKNRPFIFTDFFDKEQPDALADFIANLQLTTLEVDIDSIQDDDPSDAETSVNNQGQRDFSRYSINGEGKYNKRQTVLRSLRLYIENNPTLTAAEIIAHWNKVNPQIPFFILSSTEYETRIAEYPNQRDRFWSATTDSGEKVYVTNQWNSNRITEFMNNINNSGFDIHIEKVAE